MPNRRLIDYDTGNVKREPNDATHREVWFWEANRLFKFEIHVESYESQSYQRLWIMGRDGWNKLIGERPDVPWHSKQEPNVFDAVLERFQELARTAAYGARSA